MSNLSLYQISMEGQFIMDCLTDNEGELTPELEERLNALMIAGPDKLEAATMVVRNLEGAAETCKAEAKRLMERAKAFEANTDRLKSRMVAALDMAFNGKVQTDKFTIWTQKAADTVAIELGQEATLEQLQSQRPDFVRTKLELNKVAVKAAYDRDEPLPDSLFVDKHIGGRYLRVK